MSDRVEAWRRMFCDNTDGNDSRITVAKYDTFVEYDKGMSILGYGQAPESVARRMLDHLKNHGRDHKLLDVGAGSGLVGKALREQGYAGVLDAIDGSTGMLKQAENKNVYDDIYCQYLSEDTPLSVANELYDGVVSAAAFNHGYIDFKVISRVLNVLKPGGFLVVSVMGNKSAPEYQVNFADYLGTLTSQEMVEKVEISSIDSYYAVDYGTGFTQDGSETKCTAKLFCYKKL